MQDCSFHPTESLLAAGIITGQVRISECSESGATRKSQKRLHSESCRAVQFSALGDALLSGSADKSVVLLDTGTCKVQRTQQNAHPAGISRLAVLSETSFVSGTETLPLVLHNTASPLSVTRERLRSCSSDSHPSSQRLLMYNHRSLSGLPSLVPASSSADCLPHHFPTVHLAAQ